MASHAIIWTFAGVIAAACCARGIMMTSALGVLLWYTLGAFILAGTAIIWISLEPGMLIQHKIVLGVLGALFGSLALLSIGEWVRPTGIAHAQTPNAGGATVTNSIGDITNNQGIITQGQTGSNTIVNKPPPRSIDDAFKQFIRTNLTDKNKEIAPMVLTGDDEPERSKFLSQIEEFLKSDGYKVRPRVYFLSPGGTPMGVVIETQTDPNAILLKVGVNNRK